MRCAAHVDGAWNMQSVTASITWYTYSTALPSTPPPPPTSNLSPLAPATIGAGDRGQVRCWGDKGWCPKRPPLELTIQFLISSWFTTSGVIIAITVDVITEHLLWAMKHRSTLNIRLPFYAHGSLLGGRNPHLYMRKLEHREVESLNYGHMTEAGRTRLKSPRSVCILKIMLYPCRFSDFRGHQNHLAGFWKHTFLIQ